MSPKCRSGEVQAPHTPCNTELWTLPTSGGVHGCSESEHNRSQSSTSQLGALATQLWCVCGPALDPAAEVKRCRTSSLLATWGAAGQRMRGQETSMTTTLVARKGLHVSVVASVVRPRLTCSRGTVHTLLPRVVAS